MPDARLLRRHRPLLGDALVAVVLAGVLLAGAAAHESDGGYVNGVAVLIAAVVCVPVALRSLAPMWALTGMVAGVFLSLATFKPMGVIVAPAVLVLYTVAVTGDRRRTVLVGVAALGVAVTAMLAFGHDLTAVELGQKLAVLILPLILGEAVREHRANVAAMQERAERAERTREEEALRRVGEERLRIAREVHDVVAHSIVAINVQAGVAAHLLDRRPDAARGALTEIKRVSGEALADLRATLGVLRTDDAAAPTAPAPGFAELEDLAASVRSAGIDVSVDVRGDRRAPLPSAVESAGYRIVQEALTNVLRHSGARTAEVRVRVGDPAVEIEVIDPGPFERAAVAAGRNGSGPEPGSGHGVRGMRERAAAVGGVLDAGPHGDGGWRVRARLPLPETV